MAEQKTNQPSPPPYVAEKNPTSLPNFDCEFFGTKKKVQVTQVPRDLIHMLNFPELSFKKKHQKFIGFQCMVPESHQILVVWYLDPYVMVL